MYKTKTKRRARKRNKSSPGLNNQLTKKHRFGFDQKVHSESEDSEYFESVDYSEPEVLCSAISTDTPPTATDTMAAMNLPKGVLTRDLVNEMVDKLAPLLAEKLKCELLKELKSDIEELVRSRTGHLQDELTLVNTENGRLRNELRSLRLEHDELEQYGRRMCLDVSGITGDSRDPTEDVEKKLLELAKDQGVNLSSSDIDRCHRKGRPKDNLDRKVIVKFTNSKARERIYKARKQFGASVYVQENLTQLREQVAYNARKLVREGLLVKTWIAGCRVKATRVGSSESLVLRDLSDVDRIRQIHGTTQAFKPGE